MPTAKNPVFRKVIIPWYHSKTACGVTIAFMLMVFLFGLAGISVAHANIKFNGYIWVPLVLVLLSAFIITVTIIRLIRQHGAK